MSDEILGQVALGYSAFIDRNRAVTATRLTVFPLKPDLVLDAAQLLQAVGSVWPPEGGRVSLNVTSESLLQDLLRTTPSHNLMVEVPAFMAADPANTESIVALHAHGTTLMLKGRPLKELPREVLPCFKQAIIDLADDRRIGPAGTAPAGVTRSIPHVLSGIHSVADMEGAFERGAVAVLGWPIGDEISERPKGSREKSAPIDLQTVVELMSQVDREEPVEKLENTLKRDPSLGFKVLRYINSPAFGLSVEISSFSHAVMLLGYQRLKRWLALLLATASKEPNMKAAMFASVRRGLLMEELARHIGDQEMRNELFICGVFSLLDRLFQQPLAELLRTVPVPQRVHETLIDGTGPYAPYFRLVQAIEAESLYDFRECAEALMMDVREINRAELRALASAADLD
ncbi:MAG: HDOD domain-containing protein [Rhizobacter sp.]|nr:HDOD domain-containing protein [Rhizobacter sp.]MBP6269591.1 HDOD domain-containing protein [Rhizobacter sp.]